MKFLPLGVRAGGAPHSRRYPSATIYNFETDTFLIDAGEGTQFRLFRQGIHTHGISTIFLTHMHGDHSMGLFGLLLSLGSEKRRSPLQIIGPKGTEEMIHSLSRLTYAYIPYELNIRELEDEFEGEVLRTKWTVVSAMPLQHRVPCFGYRFDEIVPDTVNVEVATALGVTKPQHFIDMRTKGFTEVEGKTIRHEEILNTPRPPRAMVLCGDTRPCEASIRLAKNADVLIHESTFANELQEKAAERFHSTAGEAASIARDAGVERLFLTHFSNRYEDADVLLQEARAIFEQSYLCKQGEAIICEKKLRSDE